MNTSSTDVLKYVDDICRRFEEALQNASSAEDRPQLESYVANSPEPLRTRLLRELVGREVNYRRGQGETPQISEYDRFATLDATWLDCLLQPEAANFPGGRDPWETDP